MLVTEQIQKQRGSAILRPIANQAARTRSSRILEKLLKESALPTDGIYYVVMYPDGWKPYSMRFDEFPECDHVELWDSYVAPVLAFSWGRHLKKNPPWLERQLQNHPYAFPRGRVSKNGSIFVIHHGEDSARFVSKSVIERLFSVTSRCKWETDEHERCQSEDARAVQDLLKISEQWKAV